jgi:hypothetical protein
MMEQHDVVPARSVQTTQCRQLIHQKRVAASLGWGHIAEEQSDFHLDAAMGFVRRLSAGRASLALQ